MIQKIQSLLWAQIPMQAQAGNSLIEGKTEIAASCNGFF